MSIDRRSEERRTRRCAPMSTSSPRQKRALSADRLFKVQDVAEIMGVVSKTVRAWISAGKLRAMREGRIIRITSASLDDFIDAHMR
jgi:excisionase family DNA binding protein